MRILEETHPKLDVFAKVIRNDLDFSFALLIPSLEQIQEENNLLFRLVLITIKNNLHVYIFLAGIYK